MAVGFASYEIARTGLMVNERGLYVTGHNIANVNTPGYTRQQALITTGPYKNEIAYQLGLGADIQQIRQVRHIFLDNIYRNETQLLGYWESRKKTFDDIQAILGEPMEKGFQNAINQFWDSWQELSKSPDSLTVRAVVRQRAESFLHFVNHLGSQINRLQSDLDSEIRVRIEEVNSITREINRLNLEILKLENYGDKANDYRDQRNLLIDRLSKLIDVEAYEAQDGQLNVVSGGYFLVSKGVVNELYADEAKPGDVFVSAKIKGADTVIPIKSGAIKGLMEARGEVQGIKGSEENGSPYDKIDLIFAVDTSGDDVLDQTYDAVINNIDAIVEQYREKGIDVRLGIIEFDGAGVEAPTFFSSSPADVSDFKARMAYARDLDSVAGATSKSLDALQSAADISYRTNAIRQVVVLTNENPDLGTFSVADTIRTLQRNSVVVNVIADDATLRTVFEPITKDTGGFFHDDDDTTINDKIIVVSGEMRDQIYGNIHDTWNIIPDLKNRLNLLINTLAREINSLHRKGFTLDGNLGGDFFTAIDPAYPMEMGNIRLNPALSNLNNIVAAGSMVKGDNTIAKEIANLRNIPIIGKGADLVNFDDFYRSIILAIGNKGGEASRISADQIKLVEAAENYRQSIASVSMDEEMANMLKYQFAYNASSRVIGVIDDMIDTIINRMGLR